MRYIAFSKKHASFYPCQGLPRATAQYHSASEQESGVKGNNADIAILEGQTLRALKKEKNFGHLKEIYLPLTPATLSRAAFYALRYFIRGRLKLTKVHTLIGADGHRRRFLQLKVKARKKHLSERSYYPADWAPLDLLQFLDKLKANYVVLRWYDKVLHNLPMNDIDILIDDKDIARVRAALDNFIGTKPVDLHSLSGGETGRVDKIAYFPVKVGQKLLKSRVKLTPKVGYKLPDKEYFQALAYHAAFHKGSVADKYKDELQRLKKVCKLKVDLTLDGLVDYLRQSGWTPPLDMISKLAERNPWLKKKFADAYPDTDKIKGDYFIFMFRSIVKQWGKLEELKQDLKEMGFVTLYEKALTPAEQNRVSGGIRGGNWSAGTWKTDGGKPIYAVLVHDPRPITMTRKEKKNNPSIRNARIMKKRTWRSKINSQFPLEQQANFVHASDNNQETYEYLSLIAPDKLKLLR